MYKHPYGILFILKEVSSIHSYDWVYFEVIVLSPIVLEKMFLFLKMCSIYLPLAPLAVK